MIWGLSATLGNLEEASDVLLGGAAAAATQDTAGATRTTRITRAVGTSGEHRSAALLHGRVDRPLVLDTLLPAKPGRFSWAGHLGARMLAPLVDELESCSTALVFTNTRSQAETWFRLLLEARPDWAGVIALHHGSLDKAARAWVEAALKAGELKVVVATSSLDLGVDFLPVERVLQIGSAKGVARLLQRAGRSGHQPGRVSRITLVPTNTMELVEAAAARTAALAGRIEARKPPERPLDVLVQHLVTVALGGGFERAAMLAEVRTTHAYRGLTSEQFGWALDFVEGGGASLGAYPDYHRVVNVDGVHRVPDRGIARRHRLAIGTIVGDAAMLVKWVSGGSLGSLEEGFIARLKKGDCLVFGGRVLEYVRSHDMAAYVRKGYRQQGRGAELGRRQDALVQRAGRCGARAVAGRGRGRFLRPGNARGRAHAQRPGAAVEAANAAQPVGRALRLARGATASASTRSRFDTFTPAWPRCWRGGSPASGPTASASRSMTTAWSC